MTISTILLLLAFVFFVLACFPPVARIPWVPLGLAVRVLAELVGRGVIRG